jgi:hypothetical protein
LRIVADTVVDIVGIDVVGIDVVVIVAGQKRSSGVTVSLVIKLITVLVLRVIS